VFFFLLETVDAINEISFIASTVRYKAIIK